MGLLGRMRRGADFPVVAAQTAWCATLVLPQTRLCGDAPVSATPADGTVSRLSRNRDFLLLWSSQTLSETGTGATQLAMPLLVLAVTGSPTTAGAVATTAAVVEGVLRLPGGVAADRFGRRRVMLVSDAIRIVALGALIVAMILGLVSLSLIVVTAVVLSGCAVVFSPAETASISRVVPAHQLPQAFAQNEARAYGAGLAGPPIGGLLYSVTRAAPFLFDLVTFVVSFCAITAVRTPLDEPQTDAKDRRSVISQIREGLEYVQKSPFLRTVILVGSLLNFAATGALFATTVVLRQAGTTSAVIGVCLGVAAAGGLLGALAANRMMSRRTVHQLVGGAAVAITGCLIAVTVLAGTIWMVAPLALGLFFAPAANAALMSRLAATTPNRIQGRVISVVILFATAVAAVAPLTVGLLVEHTNPHVAVGIVVIAAAASGVVATLSAGLRDDTAG